jgi:hypothetical protein
MILRFLLLLTLSLSVHADDIHRLDYEGFTIWVKWFSAVALVQSLQQAKRDLDLMTAMTRLDKYQVLAIDDIGYVKKPMLKPRYYLNSLRIVMRAGA